MGSQVYQIPDLLPDAIIYSDAEGSGGRAAPIFDAHAKTQGDCLLKYGASLEKRDRAKGATLFAFEFFTVVSALWSLGGTPPGAPVVVTVDNESAAHVLTEGGPNHPILG